MEAGASDAVGKPIEETVKKEMSPKRRETLRGAAFRGRVHLWCLLLVFSGLSSVWGGTGSVWGAEEETAANSLAAGQDSGRCERNACRGPLTLRGQSAFQFLRLSLIPVGVEPLPAGSWLLNATSTWTNRWAWKKNKYLVDAEVLRVGFAATYGVTDWLGLRIEVPFCVRGGGIMDGFIQGFHDAFGLGQAGRDQFPKDRFEITLWRKDGTQFGLTAEDSGIGLEDMILSSQLRVTEGGRYLPQAFLVLHLKVPTGDKGDLYGSGSVDGGLSILLAKRIWKFFGYVSAQYTRFGGKEIAGIPMRDDQISVLTALEYPWCDRISLVVQELVNTGAARDFYQFSEASHEITFGCKVETVAGTVLELGLIENLFRFDNSPDFGVHFGVSRTF